MNRTALIVDDAATVRSYHAAILAEAGYATVEAANGFEGLEEALRCTFDLLVVDVNMPLMDGLTFVESVRRDGPNTATPIMMVTTESADGDVARGYAAGVNLYLPKPVSAQRLSLLAEMLVGRTS